MFVLLQALYIFKFKYGCVINIITLYYIFFVWNIYFLWVCLKCIHSVITGTLTSVTKMLNQVATSPAVQVFFRNPALIFLSARDAWSAFPRHSIFYIYFYDYDLPIALFEASYLCKILLVSKLIYWNQIIIVHFTTGHSCLLSSSHQLQTRIISMVWHNEVKNEKPNTYPYKQSIFTHC